MLPQHDVRRIINAVDEMRDEIIQLERSLVRFDSVNQPPWGREGPCQAFIAERMQQLGLQVDTFTPDEVRGIKQDPAYLHGRDYTERPNVVGTLPGKGGGRSLHLAAHADVVPIEKPEAWTVGPFSAEILEGKIYGRGSVDDKDGLTGMLAATEAIQKAGYQLLGDLILSSYVDEEFAGGNGLLAVIRKGYRGDAAINCDGVGFLLWVANTGGGPFRVLVKSCIEASHPTPSMHRLQVAYKRALTELSERWLAHWQHPLYPPDTSAITRQGPIEVKDWEEDLTNWNWIAHGPVCGICGYVTTLPGQERDRIKAELAATLEQVYLDSDCPDVYPPQVEWVYRFMDASEVSPKEPIVQTVGQAYEHATGRTAHVTGGVRSDLFMLALHGRVPTVSFGVGSLSPDFGSAHAPNECIDIEAELIPYVKALSLAIIDWCGYQ
jgi:acetylornithine deacetylase